MLTIGKTAADRVDIDLDGTLDATSMAEALDQLIACAEGVQHGKMLYRIQNFTMPTVGALAVEFTRLPKLFGLLGKFDRCAVVSEAAWLRTAAEVEGALFPGITIKAFTPDEQAAAETWLEASA
jgi:hypothetical protein